MVTLVRILQGVFIAGSIGCAITIPLCAWKYFSVIFEGNAEEDGRERQVDGQV